MTAVLTPLAPGDFDALRGVAERIWQEHYASILSPDQIRYMIAGRFTPEALTAYIGATDRAFWIARARDDGRPVGYLACRVAGPGTLKLEQIYVLATLRGTGLGSRMLTQVEGYARERGATTIALQVNKKNTTAMAFYTARGFAVRDAIQVAIGGGYVMDDYVMEKALAP